MATTVTINFYGVILNQKYTNHFNTRREAIKINTSILESTFLNFSKRCLLVVEKNGRYFENKLHIFLFIEFPFDLSKIRCIGHKDSI